MCAIKANQKKIITVQKKKRNRNIEKAIIDMNVRSSSSTAMWQNSKMKE